MWKRTVLQCASMVEHMLWKQKVPGSVPDISSQMLSGLGWGKTFLLHMPYTTAVYVDLDGAVTLLSIAVSYVHTPVPFIKICVPLDTLTRCEFYCKLLLFFFAYYACRTWKPEKFKMK